MTFQTTDFELLQLHYYGAWNAKKWVYYGLPIS